MKGLTIAFLLVLALGKTATAQVYKFNDGKASFFSEAPLENIEANSSSLNSALNTSTNEVVFIIPIRSFKFKKSLMEEHFNEKYMESDKYSTASYKGKINEKIDWTKNGTYTVTSQGILNVHGVGRERRDTAQVIVIDGKITISGSFLVKVADHNIAIPKLVFQNIAEVITVKFKGEYKPYQNN